MMQCSFFLNCGNSAIIVIINKFLLSSKNILLTAKGGHMCATTCQKKNNKNTCTQSCFDDDDSVDGNWLTECTILYNLFFSSAKAQFKRGTVQLPFQIKFFAKDSQFPHSIKLQLIYPAAPPSAKIVSRVAKAYKRTYVIVITLLHLTRRRVHMILGQNVNLVVNNSVFFFLLHIIILMACHADVKRVHNNTRGFTGKKHLYLKKNM